MSKKRPYFLNSVLIAGFVLQLAGASWFGPLAAAKEPAEPTELDPQLKLTRDALLSKNSSDQMRINAASVMLLSKNPLAGRILLDALNQTENDAVRQAICRALIQAGARQEAIDNVGNFIKPLVGVLISAKPATAKLAAEATLIFEYDKIGNILELLVGDASLELGARLNAMYALELHPDMRAAIALLKLLDSPEKELAARAEQALRTMDIPTGEDAKDRQQIIRTLSRQGQTAFLRRRLILKEAQIRDSRAEIRLWQGRYLTALEDVYDAISDDAERAKFLKQHLSGSETVVRLWAIEKVREDRVGTRPNPKLSAEVGPVLVKLISDADRDVRLKAASVLSFMTEVDSAQQLLSQLEAEEDDAVKIELFGALGRACYIAFLPNSKIHIPADIRKQALDWAAKFLSDDSPARLRKGAEVMKDLLEQDGLNDSQVAKYLGLLAKRYASLVNGPDEALQGELLSAMAGLCGPQSAHRDSARKQFGPLFEAGLTDKADSVRAAAVDGLVYTLGKAAALKRLRLELVNDTSGTVRKKLIALAAEVGGKEDLPWLAARMGVNSEGEPAWQAMLKILEGADAVVVAEWMHAFSAENGSVKATDTQRIGFFELAQRKAVAENDPVMLKTARQKLAELYLGNGQFEQAAECLTRLHETAATTEEKRAILPDLLRAYLRLKDVQQAAELVQKRLVEGDLDPNDAVVRSIDEYLSKPPAGADPNVVLEALSKVKTPQGRPLWREKLRQWSIRFGKVRAKLEPSLDGT